MTQPRVARDPRPLSSFRRCAVRVAGSIAGAGLSAVLASLLEVRWAMARAGHDLPWLSSAATTSGVLFPMVLAVGVAVGCASWFLHPAEPPNLGRGWRLINPPQPEQRNRLAAWSLAIPSVIALWLLGSAKIALAILASADSSPAAGVAIGVGSGLLTVVAWSLLVGLARWLELGAAWLPRPWVALAVGLAVLFGTLGYAVVTGPVSGSGGTLAVFGVLKRQELDLRPVGLLLALALGAYLGPGLAPRPVPWVGAAVIVLLSAAFGRSAVRGLEDRQLALALERGAPVTGALLPRLRRLVDRDHDGSSPYFGGGDCNDQDPSVSPGADDVPGNGIDEDCSGRDATPVTVARPAPSAARDEASQARVAADLNVVVLSVDSLRWDVMQFTGNRRNLVPNIDRLAERSVVFDRAYAIASYTGKSIPPTWIGKHTSETHRGWSHFNPVDRRDTLLQERLQRAGIRTLSVQGYWYLFRKNIGFERGWDLLDSRAAPLLGYVENDKSFSSEKIADRALTVLSDPANTQGRFFFWSHFTDPHADYVPHPGFDFGGKSRGLYDSEVAFTDHHLGRIVDFIQKSAFAARTAIIVTADHGEAFGEHGMIRHGFELWEELVRVPLVIHVPGAAPRHVEVRRSLVDLVPTVLDLMHVAPPSGQGDDFVSGQSLLLDVLGRSRPEERPILVDMAAGPHNADRQAYIDGDLKLVASNGRPLGLFDLGQDPGERKDLLDDRALRDRVVERFRAFRRGLREVRVTPAP